MLRLAAPPGALSRFGRWRLFRLALGGCRRLRTATHERERADCRKRADSHFRDQRHDDATHRPPSDVEMMFMGAWCLSRASAPAMRVRSASVLTVPDRRELRTWAAL